MYAKAETTIIALVALVFSVTALNYFVDITFTSVLNHLATLAQM